MHRLGYGKVCCYSVYASANERSGLLRCLQVVRDMSECGNGLLEGAEECDDGNRANGDGCSSSCKVLRLFRIALPGPALSRLQTTEHAMQHP